MDGLIRAVGDGIAGLVVGIFDVVGTVLRGVVDALNAALPAGGLPVLLFLVALVGLWVFARR